MLGAWDTVVNDTAACKFAVAYWSEISSQGLTRLDHQSAFKRAVAMLKAETGKDGLQLHALGDPRAGFEPAAVDSGPRIDKQFKGGVFGPGYYPHPPPNPRPIGIPRLILGPGSEFCPCP